MLVASIGGTVRNAFVVFFAWVPHLVGALAVLLVGWFVAKLVGAIVARALARAGLDRRMHKGMGGTAIERIVPRPSHLAGRLAFWAIVLATISLAASVLGIAALTAFVGAVWAYIPNLVAAFLIFLVASALAGGIAALVNRTMGGTALGKIAATVAPTLIMAIAVFMILNELRIATAIVTITYAALMGAFALGAALAFGLGGREVAGEMLRGAYSSAQENREQYGQELQQGREQARRDMERVQDRAEDSAISRDESPTSVGSPYTPRP